MLKDTDLEFWKTVSFQTLDKNWLPVCKNSKSYFYQIKNVDAFCVEAICNFLVDILKQSSKRYLC